MSCISRVCFWWQLPTIISYSQPSTLPDLLTKSLVPPGTTGWPSAYSYPSSSLGNINISSLEKDCLALMPQGLAPSTHRTYKSTQLRFLNFSTQSGWLHLNGSPCPASEWTPCLFATHLSGSLSSASIKIYLSAVRSLHIDLGFPDPLVDCLSCNVFYVVLGGLKDLQVPLAYPSLTIICW